MRVNEEKKEKTVFEYDNYRELLKDLFSQHKQNDAKFSHRFFSRVAGFKSPNFLMKVMQGKSNLSEESIEKFIKAFKLNSQEGKFFKNLVLLNQAESLEEKDSYSQQIRKIRAYQKIHPLKEAQYNYYSKWYFIPIKELAALEGFEEDPEWIAKAVVPNITPKQAKEALDELKSIGLLTYGANGKLGPSTANVATDDEVVSPSITRNHLDSIKLGMDSIQTIPREHRDISAVTLGIAQENMQKAKELISNFRKDILELSTEAPQADSIYQLNIQLFPVAEVKKNNGK